jgi:hypothetical protein
MSRAVLAGDLTPNNSAHVGIITAKDTVKDTDGRLPRDSSRVIGVCAPVNRDPRIGHTGTLGPPP